MRYLIGLLLTIVFCLNLSAQEGATPFQPDLEGDLMFDVGYNYWDIKIPNLPAKVRGSNSFSLYYNKRFELNNKFSVNPAVGFSFEKYAFSGNAYTWTNVDGIVRLDTISAPNLISDTGELTRLRLSKNKLVASYLDIPVEIRYHPLGTKEGEGWFIGAGAVIGIRLGAHTKVKYDYDQETYKEKVFDDFNLNSYRYGLQFRFGFRNIHFYYKTYLSDLFDKAPDGGSRTPRASTIGINISGF